MNKVEIKNKPLTLEEMAGLIDPYTEIVVIAPWNGTPVPVTIRMLDSVTLNACGDFNTVNAVLQKGEEAKEAVDNDIILKTKNIHENILRHSLVQPTFEWFEEHIKEKDFYINTKAKISETKELIAHLQSMEKKAQYAEQLEIMEMSLAFLLPEDFTATIVSIIMQRDTTDLRKLNRDTLLRVGLLAEKYNVRPSEYLEGQFTEKQNEDIDVAALSIVHEYREMQKAEQSGMKWIRGKNKKKG